MVEIQARWLRGGDAAVGSGGVHHACAHAELRTDQWRCFSQIPVGTTKVSYELRAEVPGRSAAARAGRGHVRAGDHGHRGRDALRGARRPCGGSG